MDITVTGLHDRSVNDIYDDLNIFEISTTTNINLLNTNLSILSDDFSIFKISTNTNLSILTGDLNNFKITTNNNFDSLNTNLSIFKISTNNNIDLLNTNLSNLNITSTTIFNKTSFNALYVTGSSIFKGASTCLSSLNISGNSIFQGASTHLSSLNVSGAILAYPGTGNGYVSINGGNGSVTGYINFYYPNGYRGAYLGNMNNTDKYMQLICENGCVGLRTNGEIRTTDKLSIVNNAPWDHLRLSHDGSTAFFDAGGAESGIAFRIDKTAGGYPASSYPEKMRLSAEGNLTTTGTINAPTLQQNGVGVSTLISNALSTYATNTNLSILSDDLDSFKITTNNNFDLLNTNLSILSDDLDSFKITTNNNFDLLNTNLSILSDDFDFLKITTISTLTTSIDEQFLAITEYIDTKDEEQQTYTDNSIETLRNEGMIQEAVTQILAWITSDEGKRFRKKVWDKIKYKWLTFTGSRPYTELLDDVDNAITDELDDSLKVFRYQDDFINGWIGGIRCDPVSGKEIVMKGDTYIYNGDLF
jgi:hypothetical protein